VRPWRIPDPANECVQTAKGRNIHLKSISRPWRLGHASDPEKYRAVLTRLSLLATIGLLARISDAHLPNMILSIVKIAPLLERRNEVLEILLSVKGPTLAVSGCLECCICEEHGDEYAIIYLEKWLSEDLLYRHIRSELYSRVLEAMELARETPQVFVVDIGTAEGMKLIREIRKVEG